jgi:hypothetical protein
VPRIFVRSDGGWCVRFYSACAELRPHAGASDGARVGTACTLSPARQGELEPPGQVLDPHLAARRSIPNPQVVSRHESPMGEDLNGSGAGKKRRDVARSGKHGGFGQSTKYTRNVGRGASATANAEASSVAQVALRES